MRRCCAAGGVTRQVQVVLFVVGTHGNGRAVVVGHTRRWEGHCMGGVVRHRQGRWVMRHSRCTRRHVWVPRVRVTVLVRVSMGLSLSLSMCLGLGLGLGLGLRLREGLSLRLRVGLRLRVSLGLRRWYLHTQPRNDAGAQIQKLKRVAGKLLKVKKVNAALHPVQLQAQLDTKV